MIPAGDDTENGEGYQENNGGAHFLVALFADRLYDVAARGLRKRPCA